jgi:hypothetical protein
VLLEIPDPNNEEIINAKINAKIKFFWSHHMHYTDLYNTSEKRVKLLKGSLDKCHQLLDSLNGIYLLNLEPFKTMEEDRVEEYRKQRNMVQYESELSVNKKKQMITFTPLEHQIAETVEATIQQKLSKLVY